ncbi:MAG: class A beta-lactamase-related serine hydrolase [Acidobacteriota bacterium]|nr:class A beta-lactamase-related serine hydrolase [Acidobacteriota bacterium]
MIRNLRSRILIGAAIYTLASTGQAFGQSDSLDRRVKDAIAGFPGTVSIYARNLDNGQSYGLRENDRVRTASTIKLPIMATVFALVEQGRAKWSETLTLTNDDKVSGSGVAHEFSDGLKMPLRDLVHLMIVVSDNTATNLILDRITADAVNDYMDKLGLKQTRSMRKVLGDGKDLKPNPSGFSKAGLLPENKRFGLGSSTPRDMVTLLEMLERGQVVTPAASKEMLAILGRQQDRAGIARKLGEMKVANKSGALDHLRSDVGIVYAPRGKIALAITCEDIPRTDYSPDNPGLLLISQLTQILIDGLGKPAGI